MITNLNLNLVIVRYYYSSVAYEQWYASSGPITKTIFLNSFVSNPSEISSIEITMTTDNYCSLNLDGIWLFYEHSNAINNDGANWCSNYKYIVNNRTFSNGSFLTFRASDDGNLTVSIEASVKAVVRSK